MSSPSDLPVEGANGGIQAGRYYGRGIAYLINHAEDDETITLARWCRYATQTLDFYTFYRAEKSQRQPRQQPPQRFTPSYLRHDASFREEFGHRGRTLLRNLSDHDLIFEDIVEVAAEVMPDIRYAYQRHPNHVDGKTYVRARER